MVDTECDDSQQNPVILKRFKFLYNFQPGSEDSLNFHTALSESSQDLIFSTTMINALLQYKWQMCRESQIYHSMLHLVFLLLHFYHLFNLKNQVVSFLMILYAVKLAFFLVIAYKRMGFSIIIRRLNEVTEAALFLSIVVTISRVTELFGSEKKEVQLTILNLITWIRAIEYLVVFKNTRIFIFMLQSILVDLKSFASLMIIFLIWFTTTYLLILYSTNGEMNLKNTAVEANGMWYLQFGDFGHYENYDSS